MSQKSHKLDPHYSDFGGLDTRSNLLTQNPKSARIGSKNFRWNYKDKLQQREGFQHKTDQGAACEAGIVEYKFRDIDTGESRTEILGVSFDGHLRKRRTNSLKLVRTVGSSVYYYSFYYDEVDLTHKMDFLDNTEAVIGSVSVTLTDTLADLVSDITALGLLNLTASVVDEDDVAVASSTVKAYLLDVVYQVQFATGTTDTVLNSAYYWELVETPDGNPAFTNCVDLENDPDFEGISYVNANNACYITDGGFPFKYDGKAVYRAGMPRILQQKNTTDNYSGFELSLGSDTGSASWDVGEHAFLFQARFTDRNGVTVLGKVQPVSNMIYPGADYDPQVLNVTGSGTYAINLQIPRIAQEAQFPVHGCQINMGAGHTITTGANTITVDSGHNIKAGMALRYLRYMEVTAVTTTTVTFTAPAAANGTFLADNQFLQGCYVPENIFDEKVSRTASATNTTPLVYGAYYTYFVTKAGVLNTYYQVNAAFDIPIAQAQEYTVSLNQTDSLLTTLKVDSEDGEDLPRACRYLSVWQTQLVQAGRPYDNSIAEDYYPTLYDTADVTDLETKNVFTYSEVHLCDYQSVYWADSEYLEGFPQSGLNEESFENDYNDSITGLSPNKEAIFVFKERTTAYLTGTLATGDLVKEFLEADVGAACMNAVQSVRGAVVFMDQNMGFWSVVAGRLPEFLGYPIQDYFKKNNQKLSSEKLNFKKAKSANFKNQDQYICYVPAGNELDPTSSSITFVFDYADVEGGKIRGAWYVWDGINAAGGMLASADGELLISQKEASNNRLWKQKFSGSDYDFSDHLTAIEMNYKGAFLTQNAPVIDKSWAKCWINSVLGGFSLRVDIYANFLDEIIGTQTLTFPSTGRTTVKLDASANIDKLSGLSWGFYHNTINEAVTIDGWEVEFSYSYDTGEAKK